MMLEKLFSSRVRVKLLTLFTTRPAEWFYLREIVRLTDESYNSVRLELMKLAELGLLNSEKQANALIIFWRLLVATWRQLRRS